MGRSGAEPRLATLFVISRLGLADGARSEARNEERSAMALHLSNEKVRDLTMTKIDKLGVVLFVMSGFFLSFVPWEHVFWWWENWL